MVGAWRDGMQVPPPPAPAADAGARARAIRKRTRVAVLVLLLMVVAVLYGSTRQVGEPAPQAEAPAPGDPAPDPEPEPDFSPEPDTGPEPAPEPPAAGVPDAPDEPVPAPSPSGHDELKQVAARELEEGAIAYNVPSLMNVGEVSEVVARISRDPDDDLSEGLDEPVRESILVGTFMEASLHDPGSIFDIAPVGDARQALLDDHREWLWDVTPRRDGVHRLRLIVTVHHEDTELERRVLSRDITVHVGWWQARWAWFEGNYPALVGAIAIAGAIGKFRAWRWFGAFRPRRAKAAEAASRQAAQGKASGPGRDQADGRVESAPRE